MNRSLAILLLLTLSFSLSRSLAQSSDNEDHVVKIDPAYVRSYRSGQVIVKFKDDSDISVRRHAPGRFQINANRVKAVNDRLGVSDMEQLMPVGGRKVMRRSPLLRSAITGKLIEDRDLSKLYLVKFDAKRTPDVHSAIEAFQELEEVEFAEPNYLVFALGTPASKPFDGRTAETDNHVMSANSATVPAVTINDPYYISQWGPAGISLPAGRCYLTPTASPVKAFAFNFGDGTGIVEQLSNCNSSNCQMFDLQGRPVSSPSRGIYTRYA